MFEILNKLSLISSRYFVWKYRDFLQLPCVLLPPLGTILATVIEVRRLFRDDLYILYMLFSQSLVPRHTLDISMKYSFVPQTEAPYKMDRYSPVDWSASEPEKVRRRIKELNKEPSTNSSAKRISNGLRKLQSVDINSFVGYHLIELCMLSILL